MIDQDLLTELQYALIEPPDGGNSWPSEVWTRLEALDAVDNGLRMLLREVMIVTTRVEIPVLANALTVALPTDWMVTALVVWRSLTNQRVLLGPVDSFEGDLALPGWETTAGTPIAYQDFGTATLTLQLVPTPLANGTLELLYVARPPFLRGEGVTLPVPDEFLSAVKYNALGWMLSKVGRMQDPERSGYCDKRQEIATIAAGILLGGWA